MGKKCRVLLIYRAMIPSIRLVGHCQMEELAKRGYIEYRACQEMKIKDIDLNWADIVLLGRLDSWYEYQLTKQLKTANKYLVYIMDDDLLNIPEELSSATYYAQEKTKRCIKEIVEMSDAILSPSPILLGKYAISGRKALLIEEPAINPVSYKPREPNKMIKIGFAGSIDRTGDIELILKEALFQIKQEFGKQVQFEFVGAIPSFADELGARVISYCDDYDGYRKILNSLEWDIGLAPMPDTPFHACKHYNKFIEYAAAGVVGVFSEVEPYTRLRDKACEITFSKNQPADWISKLRFLIKDVAQLEERRKELIQFSGLNLSVASVAEAFYSGQDWLFLYRAPSASVKISKWKLGGLKINNLMRRVKWLIEKHGIELPVIIAKKVRDKLLNR